MPRKTSNPIIMRFKVEKNAKKAAESVNPKAFASIEILEDWDFGGWMVVLTPKK